MERRSSPDTMKERLIDTEPPHLAAQMMKDAETGERYWLYKVDYLSRGSCAIHNGEMRFYEDGRTLWYCEIDSSDTGDEWTGYFSFQDHPEYDLNFLVVVNDRYHFDIHDKGPAKKWVDSRSPIGITVISGTLAENWPRCTWAVFSCKC